MKKLVLLSLVLLLIAFSLIRPQLVAQTPAPKETTETEVARLPESLAAVQEKEQPTVPREKLRYDGKSFEEWQELLETELNPERRAEAMKAFGMFGLNGYSEEAVRSIIEVTHNYEFHTLYGKNHEIGILQNASMRAFRRAASPAAMKILSEELKSGEPNRQWFAIWVLMSASARRALVDPFVDEKKFNEHAKLALPALLELISDKKVDFGMRMTTITLIQERDPQVKGFASRLGQIMQEENLSLALRACSALVKVDPETEGLVEKLIQLAGKDDQRVSALYSLRDLGPKAKAAIPGLLQILEEKPVKKGNRSGRFITVITQDQAEAPENALTAIGAEAVKPLIEAYKKSDQSQKLKILSIFQKMGAEAKSALPFLSQEYIAGSVRFERLIDKTIRSIITDKIELRRFINELDKKLKKSREDKKKAQD